MILSDKEIADYIPKIEDSYMRQIITLRFIRGMSWVQIACELGGGNSPDGVRMMVNRFLKNKMKHEHKEFEKEK